MRRRCLECDRPLLPNEQGRLCNGCYFEAITSETPPVSPIAAAVPKLATPRPPSPPRR